MYTHNKGAAVRTYLGAVMRTQQGGCSTYIARGAVYVHGRRL